MPERSDVSKLSKSPDALRTTQVAQSRARGASQNKSDIKHKTIRIEYDDGLQVTLKIEFGIAIPSGKYTTTWLLQEGKSQLEKSARSQGEEIDINSIAAFQTSDQNLEIDYRLTLPNKSLDVLPDKITLAPYIGTKRLNTNFVLKDFEIIKAIGRGGFSKVYLGNAANN